MEKKKLKLTISGSSRKTKDSIELAKSQGKKTVVIDKKNRFGSKPSFLKNETQRKFHNKPNINFQPQKSSFSKPNQSNDFEKRKLAEQRATKRLKGDSAQKGKIGSKRRELKLTLSRALSEDDIEFKARSLASLIRCLSCQFFILNRIPKPLFNIFKFFD